MYRDKLGLGLRRRARDRQREQDVINGIGGGSIYRPLPSPWDGFFQAMDEQGVTKAGDESMARAKGMFVDYEMTPGSGPDVQGGTFGPAKIAGQMNPLQVGSMAGIQKATKQRPMPESHGAFMKRHKR